MVGRYAFLICIRGYNDVTRSVRPDKLDLLFLISHFLNLGAGGRLLFITSLFKWP